MTTANEKTRAEGATTQPTLAELLRDVRPATPEELVEQGQNLAKNYKPGPRQATPFMPVPSAGSKPEEEKCWACHVPIEGCGKTGWLHTVGMDDDYDHEAHPVGRSSNDANGKPQEVAECECGLKPTPSKWHSRFCPHHDPNVNPLVTPSQPVVDGGGLPLETAEEAFRRGQELMRYNASRVATRYGTLIESKDVANYPIFDYHAPLLSPEGSSR